MDLNKENKPKRMRKVFKGIGKVVKGVAKGVIDTILPAAQNTVTVIQPTLPNESKKVCVDWSRLITAITVWILLLLVFLGKISFDDIKEFITTWK